MNRVTYILPLFLLSCGGTPSPMEPEIVEDTVAVLLEDADPCGKVVEVAPGVSACL